MKIGFFDSGVGGLTVLKKVVKILGGYEYIYLGDTANNPYGSKPPRILFNILEKIFLFFEEKEVNYLVSACNTSDSLIKSDSFDLNRWSFKYIGIVDKGANMVNKGERVLLLATENTVRSGVYREFLIKKGVKTLIEKPCPLFVPIVEEGVWDGTIAESVVRSYLKKIRKRNIDKILLGCTHYPILSKHIKKILKAQIVDPADGIGSYLRKKLDYKQGKPIINIYTTGNLNKFKQLSKRILGKNLYNISNFHHLENIFFRRVIDERININNGIIGSR